MVWEAKLDPSQKPTPQSLREHRLRFITSKYVDKAYVTPISSTLSHYSTPDETLLASIKKNDIQGVLYAIALGANTNATDRSRNTHAVFLALAAADPASPASTSPAPSPRSHHPAKVTPFPVAELLVQNGAQIPSQLPAFPLSQSAQTYIDQKSARAAGSDTLGALPNIRLSGSPAEKEREKEAKLQKRVSAGGRLVGRPLAMDR